MVGDDENKIGNSKTRRNKTRQDKTRQDKTRQDKTRQDKTRQDETGLDTKGWYSKHDRKSNDQNDGIYAWLFYQYNHIDIIYIELHKYIEVSVSTWKE